VWSELSEYELIKEVKNKEDIMNLIKFVNPINDNRCKLNLQYVFDTNVIKFQVKEGTNDSFKATYFVILLLKFVDNCRKRDFPKAFDYRRKVTEKLNKFFEWCILDVKLEN